MGGGPHRPETPSPAPGAAAGIAALREENALLTEEVLVARRASDITARLVVDQFERLDDLMRQLEARVVAETRNRDYLAALQQTTVGLLSRLDVESILSVLIERLGQFAGTPHVFLFRVDPALDRLRCTVGIGGFGPLYGKTLGRGEGLSGRVWETGLPLHVDDYDSWEGRSPEWAIGIFGAAIGAPLRAGGEVVGVLGAAHEPGSGATFDAETVTALARFAELASLALDNARLYEEAEASRREAEAAARGQSEFLANMSHEIRTPMNAILGMAELARRAHVAPRVRRWLDVIHAQGRSLLEMLDTVLDYSKLEAGKLVLDAAPFRPTDVLAGLRDLFAAKAETLGLAFEVTAAAGLPTVLVGDRQRLTQVLVNLVSNALKFSGRAADTPPDARGGNGGRVTVVAQRLARAGDAAAIRFTVADDGIGMTTEQLARIFEAFRQADSSTSRRYGGTGLGLAICRHIVQAMDGAIEVESAPGEGTTFHVDLTLPVGEDADAAGEGASHLAPVSSSERPALRHPSLDGAVVLVVDDNPINREVARELLRRHGVRVVTATNGREALRRLSAEHGFDAVLMDVQMPDMDGLETTRRLRADPRNGDLPIIAMTAYAGRDGCQRCLAAGMDDHVGKPIEEQRLVAALVRWLGPRRSEGERPPTAAVEDACVDTRSALIRLGGDERLLRELLGRFVEEHAGDVDATRRALAARDGAAIERLLHGLRGVAATLGADEVVTAAEQLAVAAAGERWSDGERLADDLTLAMDRLAHAIHGHEEPRARPEPVTAWPLVKTPRLVALLQAVRRALSAHDLGAEDAVSELRARLRGTVRAGDAERLERAVRALDYPRAARRLARLAADIGAEVDIARPAAAGFEGDDGRATVLVVDDVATNVRLLGAALRPEHRVCFALDGEEALRRLADGLAVDLVLLDVVMPGLDGHEVCRRLKETPTTRDVPVIFVTGRAEDADVTRGLSLGAVDYITRPLSLPVVRARVRAHLELKRNRDALATLSIEDPLTGLANRRHFDETLGREWARVRREAGRVAVVMVDIDHFKAFNDTYGHPAGDGCLRQVAAALRGVVRRGSDLVARYGGEEFAAILPDTDGEGARVVAERMRRAVVACGIPNERTPEGVVTISAGVAPSVAGTDGAAALVEQADRALYAAKAAGRNRVEASATGPGG